MNRREVSHLPRRGGPFGLASSSAADAAMNGRTARISVAAWPTSFSRFRRGRRDLPPRRSSRRPWPCTDSSTPGRLCQRTQARRSAPPPSSSRSRCLGKARLPGRGQRRPSSPATRIIDGVATTRAGAVPTERARSTATSLIGSARDSSPCRIRPGLRLPCESTNAPLWEDFMTSDIRVPPVEPGTRPELTAIENEIIQARGEIMLLYKVLLNSPPLAAGWEKLLTAIRRQSTVPPDLRELIILRVAVVNRAPYEFEAHVPHARR